MFLAIFCDFLIEMSLIRSYRPFSNMFSPTDELYCSICEVFLNSKQQLDSHQKSTKHKLVELGIIKNAQKRKLTVSRRKHMLSISLLFLLNAFYKGIFKQWLENTLSKWPVLNSWSYLDLEPKFLCYEKIRAYRWSVSDYLFALILIGQLRTLKIIRNESNWQHKNLWYRLIHAQ